MKLNSPFVIILAMITTTTLFSCKKENFDSDVLINYHAAVSDKSFNNFPESFESGTKTSYSAADIILGSGNWNLNDALIGNSTSDRKNGSKSVRIQNAGTLTMNFDVVSGVSVSTVYYAKYGSDANSSFELWYSTNSGSSWVKSGNTITASSTTLSKASFTINSTVATRLQIRKINGGRLNIDDLDIQDLVADPTRDDNLALGNPSNAVNSTLSPNNYLMVKTQYALSYNNSRGSANWVSWHLSPAWKGGAARCDCFAADNTLPSTFYKASSTSYSSSGFDRGHICPSEDRDSTSADNAATFLMTNMIPQSPNLNRITWVALEDYCRTLMNAGNELYIISGGYGNGGTGSNGGVTTTIASGKIAVPSNCWKVILVLPLGSNDLSRISSSTRVIAVNMPNNQNVNSLTWGNYRTSVDAIEALTGYDLLSLVPVNVQASIESVTDNGPTN